MAFNIFAPQKQQNNPNEQPQAVQQQRVTQQVMQPVALPSQPQQTPVAKPQPTLPAIDPNSDTAGMDALSSMVTTPQEEERMRKASVANRRIMAVADALRHIGNIYNTVNYAPAQQFNNPVVEEQQRYEKGKALRDAANLKYYTYQQAKAAQDAKARQLAAQAAHQTYSLAETIRHNKENEAINRQRNADRNAYYDRMLTGREQYNNARIDIANKNAETSRIRANKVGTGGGRSGRSGGSNMPDYEVLTENTLNEDGRIVSQKKTRTVKRGGQSTTTTKTTKKPLPGQTSSTTTTGRGRKRLPGT